MNTAGIKVFIQTGPNDIYVDFCYIIAELIDHLCRLVLSHVFPVHWNVRSSPGPVHWKN
jgi:hypothetical protein